MSTLIKLAIGWMGLTVLFIIVAVSLVIYVAGHVGS